MTPRKEAFEVGFRVRWSDVDQQGVVFFPRYLEFGDMAVAEAFRAIGCPLTRYAGRYGAELVVVSASADLKAPARYDDELLARSSIVKVGRTSLRFSFVISRKKQLCAQGQIVYVNASCKTHKAVALDTKLRRRLVLLSRLK